MEKHTDSNDKTVAKSGEEIHFTTPVSKSDSEGGELQSTKFPSRPYPREPITAEYFDAFFNSTLLFSQLRFTYFMGMDMEHIDAREQYFRIQSRFTIDPQTHLIISSRLSDLSIFNIYYNDLDTNLAYNSELTLSQFNNILQIMQSQDDYYFNAEEYGGEESLDIAMEGAYGHVNYVTFTIEEPVLEPYTHSTVKTLCKGWDPGDDPPAELTPMINYLENVVIPEMRNHPYP